MKCLNSANPEGVKAEAKKQTSKPKATKSGKAEETKAAEKAENDTDA